MNAVATRPEPKTQIVAGGEVMAIIPKTLDEVWRLSTAIASASGMAPRGMDKPEQIMVAIMAGSELGMPPFQALQSFAVVNGRPTLWGDGLMAVVKARGVRVKEWLEGENDAMTAFCEVTRPDNGEVTLGQFSVLDAKKAGLWNKQGPWQQYPKRMLKMRARVALRDGCADMLRGFQIREEIEDYQPIHTARSAPQPSGLAARLSAPRTAATEGFNVHHGDQAEESFTERLNEVIEGDGQLQHDADTGEVLDDLPAGERSPAPAVAESGERDGAVTTARSPQPDDDQFPGDQLNRAAGEPNKPPAENPKPATLTDRIAAFKKRATEAKTSVKLTSVWAAAAQLRNDIDAGDPDEVGTSEELETFTNGLMAKLEEAEREQNGGGR